MPIQSGNNRGQARTSPCRNFSKKIETYLNVTRSLVNLGRDDKGRPLIKSKELRESNSTCNAQYETQNDL